MATLRRRMETCELSGSDLLPTQPGSAQRIARGTRNPFEVPSITPDAFGSYLVYEELGVGGMATVHRAEAPGILGFRKPVALKRMLPHVAKDPKSMRAFLEEARLASRLVHENIAQAYDFGVIGGTYFIAMEMVPGPTLRQIMIQCASAAGAIPVPIAIEILIQLCEALDYAHNLKDQQGRPLNIIHRDVSPTNVIVSASGIVKLIDFGIAKAERASEQTQAGIIKGKLGYLAPEYLAGRLDLRADLFGLGVVAHELLTGKRLFPGTTDCDVCQAVREKPIAPPSRYNSQVSATLDDIVLTALQRDPSQRWQSAHAMQVALRNAAREYGAGVSHRQIRDWAEWAFSQHSRTSIEIKQIAEPTPPEVSIVEHETIVERPARRASTLRNKTPRPIAAWLLAVLVLGIAGVGLWDAIDGHGIETLVRDLGR